MPVPSVKEGAKIEDVESPVVETVKEVKASGPIHVIATRAGFFKQQRRVEGDKFTIDGEHQLGTWMKKI